MYMCPGEEEEEGISEVLLLGDGAQLAPVLRLSDALGAF